MLQKENDQMKKLLSAALAAVLLLAALPVAEAATATPDEAAALSATISARIPDIEKLFS